MALKNKWISALAGVFILSVLSISCEEDLDTLGDGVIAGEPFITAKAEYDVFAFNRSAVGVQTNQLPLYQVGVYDDPVFGRREAIITSQVTFVNRQGNPVFGNYRQDVEDLPEASRGQDTIPENETIKEVILYIPYQLKASAGDSDNDGVPNDLDADPDNPDSDSDGDGVTDNEERSLGSDPLNRDEDGTGDDFIANNFPQSLELDSILSRRYVGMEDMAPYIGEEFNFKVERSTFFLRDLDPNANFEESQEYFSNTNIPSFVDAEPLFEGTVELSNRQIPSFFEDDPDTEDDESRTIESRLPPGIRVALNSDFFQENILDKEGSFELLSQSNFSEFLRGLQFSVSSSNGDLMLLLDLTQANITITYEFDDFVVDDVDGEDMESVEKVEREFILNFLQVQNNVVLGNAVNTFINDPFPSDVVSQLDTEENASQLFIKGGSGTFTELRLFDDEASAANTILQSIRDNNWIINEANLIFHVDRSVLDANGGTIEPSQLYLSNANSNLPLFDTSSTDGFGSLLDLLRETFGGNLEKGSDGKGTKYTIRITDYINDLVVRDSTLSPLTLSLSSSLLNTATQEAESVMGTRFDLPVANTLNPLGTVLFGNNISTEEQDKKLKLQIFYTETN